MSKLKKRQYILGELAASSAPAQPASVVRKLTIAYTVLDNFMCHTVFLEVPQIPRSVLKPSCSVFENVSIMQWHAPTASHRKSWETCSNPSDSALYRGKTAQTLLQNALCLTSFKEVWRQHASDIVIMKPRCKKCFVKISNLHELRRQQEALQGASEQREFYEHTIVGNPQ